MSKPVISSLTKTKVIVNEKITLSLTKTETETRKFELTRTEKNEKMQTKIE